MASEYQAIVIGGGITGAGVARDCAMRGIKTLLLEKNDFGSGTTGTCMGMMHGGVRYMITEPEVTRLSCTESGIIQRLIPYLVFRIPWIIPIFPDDPTPQEMYIKHWSAYDELGKLKYSDPHVLLSREDALTLEPALNPGIAYALTMDEPGINVFRLVMGNVLGAVAYGADVRNHTEVVALIKEGDRVRGVKTRDTLTGEEADYYADMVLNAAGPWTPYVAELAGIPFKLRPTKGIHIFFDRRITNSAVNCFGVSLLPHENTSMCGLTDDFYFLRPEEVRSERNEAEGLLAAVAKTIPSSRQARILRTMAGVRPLLDQPGSNERDLTRHHEVYDHEAMHGVKGFLTVAGGKMVLYRKMAEDLTNLLCQKLGIDEPCRTDSIPLPGGDRQPDITALAETYSIPLHTVARLVTRHGTDAERILDETRSDVSLKSNLCECEPVLEAEVRYAIEHEWARTLDDVRRRTRLGMGPCQGFHCSSAAGAALTAVTRRGPSEAHRDVMAFLQERWKGRFPVIGGTQLRQEEITRAVYLGIGGYDNPDLQGEC